MHVEQGGGSMRTIYDSERPTRVTSDKDEVLVYQVLVIARQIVHAVLELPVVLNVLDPSPEVVGPPGRKMVEGLRHPKRAARVSKPIEASNQIHLRQIALLYENFLAS
jgi:hypothetical protein